MHTGFHSWHLFLDSSNFASFNVVVQLLLVVMVTPSWLSTNLSILFPLQMSIFEAFREPFATFAFICRLVSGTSLVAVVSTAVASSYTYVSHGVVDAAAALVISCCAVLTAPLGANLTATLNATVSCSPEVHDCMRFCSDMLREHSAVA